MILFYCETIGLEEASLQGDEYAHCIKALRHKSGDQIFLTDGQGQRAKAEIIEIGRSSATLQVHSIETIAAPKYQIHLFIAPPKSKTRWEWLLEKSVEIGITAIHPMITARSERKKINLDRARKVMKSAALQSLRIHHPSIEAIKPLPAVLDSMFLNDSDKLLAHFVVDNPELADIKLNKPTTCLFIGPEGDFTAQECDNVIRTGARQVNISMNRLRTETAAIVSITQCVMKIGQG